jgi:CRP-like cAMP-binding protein
VSPNDEHASVTAEQTVVQARLLRKLTAETRNRLLRGAVELQFAPGEQVNHPHEPSKQVGLVLDGVLRNYLVGPAGREQTTSYLHTGDFLGASELLGRRTAVATQCVTAARFVRMSPDAVRDLMESEASVAVAFAGELARVHYSGLVELHLAVFATVRERVAHQLLVRAGARGDVLTVTHRELALSVGSVREVVGRAVNELESDGALRRTAEGQLELHRDRLREIVDAATGIRDLHADIDVT